MFPLSLKRFEGREPLKSKLNPIAGFVDDAAIIAAAVIYLRKELKNYLI